MDLCPKKIFKMRRRQYDYNIDAVLPELRKLKGFFEDSIKDERPNSEHGSFGQTSVFFGNVIQHCNFGIPASAMKLIYEFNKERIDNTIERLSALEKELDEKANNGGVV